MLRRAGKQGGCGPLGLTREGAMKEPSEDVQGLTVGSLGASVTGHWTIQSRWKGAILGVGSWLQELREL